MYQRSISFLQKLDLYSIMSIKLETNNRKRQQNQEKSVQQLFFL